MSLKIELKRSVGDIVFYMKENVIRNSRISSIKIEINNDSRYALKEDRESRGILTITKEENMDCYLGANVKYGFDNECGSFEEYQIFSTKEELLKSL